MPYEPRIFTGRLQRALILENPHPSLDDQLRAMGIEVERIDRALSEDALAERLRQGRHNLLFKRSRSMITREVIAQSPDLCAILLCCIGDDSVDKKAAADHGVLVLNDPISNGRSVAELIVGEMLVLARRVIEADAETHAGKFSKSSTGRYELLGKSLGIFGLGNIGRQVAQLGTALGMDVHFYDTRELSVELGTAMGWKPCLSLVDLFRQSHVVTVHVSSEDVWGRSNEGILHYDHFREMNQEAKGGPRLFLNAARGFLHATDDLKRAVREGHIDAAFVDVFPEEPESASEPWQNPYADCPEVHCTPHIGAATVEAQPRIAAHIATTTRLFHETGTVRDCVFRPGVRIGADPGAQRTVLAVVHSDTRGTKKAVDDAIFDAGASNLQSAHRDFPRFGIAYDLNVLDTPLSDEQIHRLIQQATALTGDRHAIRSVRQFTVPDPS